MEQLEATPLFVAATRPAMILGLPLGMFVLFIMAFSLIMVLGQKPYYEAILLPAWFGARLLLRYDYNAVRIAALGAQTKFRSFDAHRWGGASPAPFPVRPARHPRGIPNAR